jgi:hypothetical protein
MALITIGSLRSSAVTTTALLLARRWVTERELLLAELDPAGGTLAAMLGRRSDPGLQSLAAAARRELGVGAVPAHAQPLGGNRSALLAPATGEQVRDALSMLGDLEELLRDHRGDVICDCGRLDVASPVLSLFSAGEVSIIVVRSDLADLRLLDASLGRRGLRSGRVVDRLRLVLVGSGPYGADEVAEELGLPVLGNLPIDAAGVAALVADEALGGLRARSRLLRAGTALAESVVELLAPSVAVEGFDPVADAEELLR